MTEANPFDPVRAGSEEPEPAGPKVTDKRRLDPLTGAVRHPASPSGTEDVLDAAASGEVSGGPASGAFSGQQAAAAGSGSAQSVPDSSVQSGPGNGVPDGSVADDLLAGDDVHPDTTLAADLTRDLQRLQAEYVNYKKRVDRDRAMHRDLAVCSVIETLLPVLDDVHLARQHGDLEGGPFAAIADKLDGTLTKLGVERFGQPGDAFDPTVHEALMHIEAELAVGTEVTTVVQVLQPGYRMGERMIRVARVAVADPSPNPQP